ncbi:MAG: MFS transporter [Nitrososphaerales archaeon]
MKVTTSRLSFATGAFRSLLALDRPPDQALTPAQVEANIRHLVGDIAWFGLVTGTFTAFLQVYVVRLGAPSLLVGAITYGPALISIFWLIPAGRLITRTGRRMRWVLLSGLAYRGFFLVVALIPFFFAQGQAVLTTLVWVFSAFATSVSNVSFLSMMADAVPPERRARMVGLRIAAFGITNTVATLLAGPLLARIPFPLNYQVLFLIGFAGSMMSWWNVHHIHVPDPPPQAGPQADFRSKLGGILRFPGYFRFLVAVFVLQLALGMIAPLLPLYWVRSLGATDQQVSLVLSTATGMMVVGSLLMRRAVNRVGREVALAVGALGYALYPLLTSLTTTVWWLIPGAAMAGLFSAAINVNLFDNLVAVTPEEDRTDYMSVYNTAANCGLFLGPLIAGLLAQAAGGPGFGLQVAAGVGICAGILLLSRANRGGIERR